MEQQFTLKDVYEFVGIKKASIEDLLKMSPEELEKYYKEHSWGHGRDDVILDLHHALAESEYDENGRLLIRFDLENI